MDRRQERHSRIIVDPEWVPDGSGIERVDELRAEHQAAVNTYREAVGPSLEASERFFHEDRAHPQALREWYAAGKQGDPPERTQQEERDRIQAPLAQHARAAHDALLDKVEAVEREFAANELEMLAALDARRNAGLERAGQLRREAQQAEASIAGVDGLIRWVGMTAHPGPFGHQPSQAHLATELPEYDIPNGGIETIEVGGNRK